MAIYNFIGQPHSGKTTLANHLKKVLELINPDRNVFVIDGDILRKIINNRDYSEAGRRQNITTAYNIAKYLDSTENFDVIIAVVSPFIDLREKLKLETDAFEIFVHTTNIRGRESYHVENYEYPESNFIDIDTTDVDELTSVNDLLNKLNLKIKNND
jgi:adenylylsulfate kinase-like enzyme